jgi:hypothetical protein
VRRGARADVSFLVKLRSFAERLRSLWPRSRSSVLRPDEGRQVKSPMKETQDILLPLEKSFPIRYREYYETKRNNFFASITHFPSLWSCFMRLDDIFGHEFEDLKVLLDSDQWLPLMLFMHAHAQFRIFMELGFSGAFCEAYNIARMAIESVYQACKILAEPGLNEVWAKKESSEEAAKAFDEMFVHEKKQGYLDLKLGDLHKHFTKFSNWSHPSISSLNMRFRPDAMYYLEADEEKIGLQLMQLLFASVKLENALFESFGDRLKLDPELGRKRSAFRERANQTRLELIERFKLKPPEIKSLA